MKNISFSRFIFYIYTYMNLSNVSCWKKSKQEIMEVLENEYSSTSTSNLYLCK